MCGRFTLIDSGQLVLDAFGLPSLPLDFRPRYNAAPGQPALVVRERQGERTAAMLRWGLVPFWAKDPKIGNKLINARSETVMEKPSFRHAFERRRCAIPADGFFEWVLVDGKKTPFRFRLADGGLFAFAGLWESWRPSPDLEPLHTFTVLTTEPNDLVAPVHNRMPVMLRPSQLDAWLDPEVPGEAALSMLKAYPADEMEAYRVSSAVNSTRNDSPECIAPVGGEAR